MEEEAMVYDDPLSCVYHDPWKACSNCGDPVQYHVGWPTPVGGDRPGNPI